MHECTPYSRIPDKASLGRVAMDDVMSEHVLAAWPDPFEEATGDPMAALHQEFTRRGKQRAGARPLG